MTHTVAALPVISSADADHTITPPSVGALVVSIVSIDSNGPGEFDCELAGVTMTALTGGERTGSGTISIWYGFAASTDEQHVIHTWAAGGFHRKAWVIVTDEFEDVIAAVSDVFSGAIDEDTLSSGVMNSVGATHLQYGVLIGRGGDNAVTSPDTIVSQEVAGTDYNSIYALSSKAGGASVASTFVAQGDISQGAVMAFALVPAAVSFEVTTSPASITAGTQASVVVSNPATTPTTGNTQVKFDDDSGPAATVNSVSGSGPYTINFTFPTSTAKQFGSHELYVEVASENDTTATIPYNPPAGQAVILLAGTIPASPAWASGSDYSTGDEVYYQEYIYSRDSNITDSTIAPADGVDGWTQERRAQNAFDGYDPAEDAPTANDQAVYVTSALSGTVTFALESDGNVIITPPPPSSVSMAIYVIRPNGEIGQALNWTFSVDSDTTPDQFSLTPQTGAPLNTPITSNTFTLSGITAPAAMSIVGGEFSYNIGAGFSPYSSTPVSVPNGAQIRVRLTSSGSFSTLATATLTIGGVSAAFNVTTVAADTTPTQFSFNSQTGVPQNAPVESNTITVSGINSATAISITGTGATYAVNGGTPTSSSGTVNSGDTVSIILNSSTSPNSAVSATLTIGGVSATFTVTTAGIPGSQPAIPLPLERSVNTAATMIERALRLINVPGRGARLAAADYTAGFEALQELLASRAISSMVVPGVRRHFFALRSGQSIYNYGPDPAADFRSDNFDGDPAPVHIDDARIRQGTAIVSNEQVSAFRFETLGNWVLSGDCVITNNQLTIQGVGVASQSLNLVDGTAYRLTIDVTVGDGTANLLVQGSGVDAVNAIVDSSGLYTLDFEYAGSAAVLSISTDDDDDVEFRLVSIIERGRDRYELPDGAGFDRNVEIIGKGRYNRLITKGGAGTVCELQYSRSFPYSQVRLNAGAQSGDILVLDVIVNSLQIATLNSEVKLHGEALMWLRYELANLLAGEYGKALTRDQLQIKDDAYNRMTAANMQVEPLTVDNGLRGSGGRYNIYNDE